MSDNFHLQEECQALQDLENYSILNEADIDFTDEGAVTELLEGAVETVAEGSDAISNPDTFDVFRSLLKHAHTIPGSVMSKLLDSVSSGLQAEVDATMRDVEQEDQQTFMAHRVPLEMYAFLLQWFVSAAEKVKSRAGDDEDAAPAPKARRGRGGKATVARTTGRKGGAWSWIGQIPATLSLIGRVLRLKTHRIWTTTPDRDAFIACITRPAYHIAENEQYMRSSDIRLGVYKVICLAVKHHGHGFGAQISIMQCLQYYEHLSEPMAEALTVLAKEFDHSQLAEEILREIAAKDFNNQDTKGPRAFSRFLVRFAELSPRVVLKQFSLLVDHLDSESYPMRMAIVEVMGCLIRELSMIEDGEGEQANREKKINGLFDLLIERYLDLNSYVRAKVINTLSKICDLPAKFPKQRLAVTETTIAALEDKSSSVRRYAIALLTKLLLTHPYGLMHGGLLKLEEWEERYKAICDDIKAIDSRALEGAAVEKEGEEEEGSDDEDEDEDEDDDEEEGDGVVGDELEETVEESDGNETITSSPMKRAKNRMRGRSKSVATYASDSEPGEEVPGAEMEVDPADASVDDSMPVDEEGDTDMIVDGDMDVDGEKFVLEDGTVVPSSSPSKRSRKSTVHSSSSPRKVPQTPKTPRAGGPAKTPRTVKSIAKKPKTKKKAKKARRSELDISALTDEQVALAALESDKLLHLKLRKRYYAEGLQFIRAIEGSTEQLAKLLLSQSKAEVLEAMEFFRVAHEYHFGSSEVGIKQMLHLIWSKDNNSVGEDGKELKSVRLRLIECYRSLYFDPVPDMEPKQQVTRITKNMIELTYNASLAELTSLEEMMRMMMDEDQIHPDVIAKLWQVYGSDRNLPKQQRRGAIIILGMLAVARRHVVMDKKDLLLKVGLGAFGKADLTLARYTCVALQRLNGSVKKVKGSLLDKSLRIDMDNPIFHKLQEMIELPCRTREWFAMTEQAINTIYALGDHPDVLCDTVIKNLTRRAFSGMPSTAPVKPDPDVMDEDVPTDVNTTASPQPDSPDMGDAFHLSQLLFVVGHVALKQIVYLELIEREWKRQEDEKQKAEKATAASPQKSKKDKEGEELDQVAGNAEDEIGDRIAGVRETELLYGPESLLAVFGPMLVHICGSPKAFKNRTLRAAATLSLSKFLCVSSRFCEDHHRLLFKILEISKDPTIRSNIVIALGDVAVCFSNIIDENSNELYKGLTDRDQVVKKNTLMVLTHLILNGMIKVKGQLGEMAKCLEDPDPRIADLARLFFSELSTKDNAIYNNLPDVISHLSVGEHSVDEETFQSTMKYIFKFIEKEKQAENIVEKLCQRFRLTEEPRQWRDLAYCLSLLPFKSEKSMKKLIEGLQFYRDKLHEEAVFARFAEILAKARMNKSQNKPDSELKEFENILEEHKRQGEEDQALQRRVEGKKAAAKRKATRKTTRKKPAAPVSDADESDHDDW